MEKFVLATRRFMRDEEGVTAIEYGLIASLVAVAIILGATALGGGLNELFKNIAACLGDTTGGGKCPVGG
ncbi:MAG: Flp family type IVb pilin [Rhodoferax sp.]|uniref:Flp family type IVb pilin n=1 Tax=Rhodoferax sp. TaxID=50421 RepID=UPI0027179C52|nr:Flp family type IVb pilin [Rhodoferax sp.]MDO9200271.1 Flp family type IVb pilin [Hydrogenophaga sp.]MDP3866566.1 Flp family type IVb pilin [Rhodoferax sp.]